MIKKTISLADKIVFIVIMIFVLVYFILFSGGTYLTKKAFFNLEKEKAELITKNYAPILGLNLFLGMDKKVKLWADKILKNNDVIEVNIYKNGKKIYSNKKSDIHCSFKAKAPILKPNSKTQIGTLEILYSTSHFENFMKNYFVYLFLSVIFIVFSIFSLYLYIKKLLLPLKKLSNMLQNYNPEVKIDIEKNSSNDEISLISNAILISNQKTLEYSSYLKEANKNLEKKVQEELAQIREKDKQLIHQSRLAQMGEMINMIAHQWRQPLSSINSTINNLIFKLKFEQEVDKDLFEQELKLIENYSQHLSETIDDFRNFFKKNKNLTSISIKSLFEDTLNIAKVSLENKNISVKIDYLCDIEIKTYPNEIKQVLLNLIKNAQDALIENNIKNPYISIYTRCDENNVILIIEDNAGGIPNDIIEHIFDPYFSTKLEKDGTGLGLYMSKTIIQEHCNGKLDVENSDFGAKFTIKLPINNNKITNRGG
jgi:signal transduction histidine kinase